VAELLSKIADMHIEAAVKGRQLSLENALAQVLLLYDLTGVAQQLAQQLELDRC
jgi:hypothetical protein